MRFSLQTKLMASFIAVIIVSGAISAMVGVGVIGKGIVNQAQDKVRLDLNSARVIYGEAVGGVREAVRHTSVRFFLADALKSGDVESLAEGLEDIRRRERLDVMNLLDPSGRVLLRSRNPSLKGDDQSGSASVRKVLSTGEAAASTEIVPYEQLAREGEELVALAHTEVVATPKAKPSERSIETSGMMIVAAAPVMDGDELLGILCGGRLLNGDVALVDRIKETVYQGEAYGGRDTGTATIFQGDVRISTNVLTTDGARAVGTRVSADVYDRVIVEGKPWIERAYVVNDWYMTAYEPIRNGSGEVIGILYVGLLEKPFEDMKRNALWTFVGISLAGVALSVVLSYLIAASLMGPLKNLIRAARELAAGNLKERVVLDDATRGIADLGRSFNLMAASIEERDAALRQRAQEEIMKSERLALMGRLAAGVAHEINNPLGGMLLLSKLLLRSAPEEGVERENLQRIANEAERCQRIVQGLLDFARQNEPHAEPVDLRELAEKSAALLENQAAFLNVNIVRKFEEGLPRVHVDPSQMQQVFINVIMNAAEAMEEGGTLTIETRRGTVPGRVEIAFSDTGCGISQEDIGRIFEPFFTTKEVGKGTGLGLSISHGIVERHGGSMSVASEIGKGTTCVISLPVSGDGD